MNRILYIGLILNCFSGFAQDMHFTQTAQTPTLINPGACAVFNGWERFIVNHRNQWLGANTQFMTTNISAEMAAFKPDMNDRAHLGIGVQFFNDVGGDSKFGHRQGSLTLNAILPMGGNGHTIGVGLQGGVGNRSANATSLDYRSQWDGEKFDKLILTGDMNKLGSFTYIDASTGVYYVYDGSQSTFQGKNNLKVQAGISAYHVNAPKFKFSNGTTAEQLHRKYVGLVGVTADIGTSALTIDANAVQTIQGTHFQTLFGAMLRYRFEEGTYVTGNSQESFIGLGLYTRWKDAIMPSILIDWKSFQFGISYDITISKLRNAYRGGSLEFSLSYSTRNTALFKGRGRF